VLPVQLRCRQCTKPEGEDPGLPAFSLYFDRADLVPDDGFNQRRSRGTVVAPPLRAGAEWWRILPVSTNLSCQDSASARR
jgi:hypothetical protein